MVLTFRMYFFLCFVLCNNKQSRWRSVFYFVLDQLCITVRPYPSSVPPGVKDIFIWLTETPAPSDFVCSVPYKFSYLLTLLLLLIKFTFTCINSCFTFS